MKPGIRTFHPNMSFARKLRLFILKYHVNILSFFLPAIILEIAYITCGIFPFGKWSLLIIDLYHQYAPFLSDLQDKLRSFSSLFYSWSGGLGISYLPLFAYYLASPLNPIIVLFPKECLTEAVLVLTLLKAGLAGVFFSFYLKGVHRRQNLVTLGFSLFYALSGYVLAFSWNIMWLDVIYIFPLVMLGLVRLVRDARGLFYCIMLAIALFSNFYIASFICIFALLYYPICLFKYHSINNPALLIKRTVQFAGFSLLSAGLSAILLLPTFFALRLTSAVDDIFPRTLTNYFDLFNYTARHFSAALPSIREGMPNLYCGILVLILIPVYFFCRSIKLKEKLMHIALLIILILSFNINILNFIWHGFHYPNQVPYRFSFVYVFLILSMSYEAYKRMHEFTRKQIGAFCALVLVLAVISQKFDDIPIEYLTLYISAISVILYAAVFTINRGSRIRPSYKALFLALVITAEVTANTIFTIQKIDIEESYAGRDGYSSGKEAVQIREQISAIAAEDKSFYRMEIIPPKTVNDPFLYNYRGLSVFSSTLQMQPVKMLKNLGYHSNSINSYVYEGSTAILDSLLGIKYLIYRSISIDERMYRQIAATDELTVFTNPYALPPGFLAASGFKDYHSLSSNPFNAQNSLVESICGIRDVLIPIDKEQGTHNNLELNNSGANYYSFKRKNKEMSSTARIRIKIEQEQQVYLYFKAPSNMKGSGFVMLNDKKVDFNPRHSTLINLGFCKPDTFTELQVTFDESAPESGWFEVYACALNQPVFEEAMSIIKQQSMVVESFTDTYIRGHINAGGSSLMVMTIPFDKGWRVTVDNREVETFAIDNCLLGFDLPAGSHTVELRFIPDKFFTGLAITVASVLIFILLLIRQRHTSKLMRMRMQSP